MEKTLEKENIANKNEENSTEEGAFFYIMTLQTDSGKKHQIKIYENSNASELAFNFCKDYNLDFPTMKYLKKSIKQIIQQFQNKKMNEMIYLFKDNNSIQEVAEEEVITDNSLKKSGTFKKNSNNSQNKKTKITIEEEENNSKQNNSKEKKEIKEINENIKETSDDDNNIMNNNDENTNLLNIKEEKKESDDINIYKNNNNNKEDNNQHNDEKNKLKEITSKEKNNEINEFEILKSYNTLEDDEHIEHKDFSIDYCLDNDSVQIFSPTEQTTKIEQRSSIKNSSSLTKNKYSKYPQEKKNNSKINKSQNSNNTNSSNKPIVRQSFLFNYNKLKNKKSDLNINNELIKRKVLTKKNSFNNKIIKKNHPSLERMKNKKKNKSKNKSPVLELNHLNKKTEAGIQAKPYKYKTKYEKFLISMNDMRNRYFSNYYNYFMKSKNIYTTLNRNNVTQKFRTNNSLNQDSSKSKSLSHNKKNNKNKVKKSLSRKNDSKRKKEKSMIEMNTLNYQKLNNSSKINLNTILKKEFHKQRTVFKNRTKSKYNITYHKNNNLFSKTINKRSFSFRRKKTHGKELFLEIKRSIPNSNGFKKMVATSLINIHKIKNPKEKKRNSLLNSRILKGYQIKTKIHKNRELFNKLFRCESTVEKKNKINKIYDKLHFELKNTNNNSINSINQKTKRNNTDANYIQNKNSIKIHHKGRLMTYHKLN